MALAPLFGAANFGKSSNVSAQRRVNLYTEVLRDPDKSRTVLYGRPGLVDATPSIGGGSATLNGAVLPNVVMGPVRGMLPYYYIGGTGGVNSGVYGVMGNVVFNVVENAGIFFNYPNTAGLTPFDTTSGAVAIASDGLTMFAADGVAGYTAAVTDPGTWAKIADTDFPQNCTSVCVVASRYVVNDPLVSGRFRWSDAGDGTSWDPLSFATAESSGDPLVAVFESNGELLLFGRETLEFWAPTGDDFVYARVGGSAAQWGTQAPQTIAKFGAGVAFLGYNRAGNRQVVMTNGYTPQAISDPDVERDINNDPSPDSAVALTYTADGHQFYQLNLSTTSWVYDLTSGLWQEFQTGGSRHAAQFCVNFLGSPLLSHYADTRFARLSSTTYTDFGSTLTREATSRHIFNDLDRVTCWELTLDAETGVGLSSGLDPQIMLQVSKDGGHTFGSELWVSLGKIGQYLARATWRRLGRSRDWVFRFRVTDPVKVTLLSAAVRLE